MSNRKTSSVGLRFMNLSTALRRTMAVGLSLAALSAGCAGETIEEDAPPFPEGQGQSPNVGARYPAGPFGIEKGSISENYKFIGFPDPSKDKSALREIQLADFYNPTGDEVWPADSIYAGKKKPKALLIVVSAVWCGPCQYENAEILPDEYAKYNPLGAEFFLLLADGPTVGKPAETKHLINWTTKYNTAWPAVLDPGSKLSALFEADAFPANLLIDTTTMEIVDVVAGVPEQGSSFYVALEGLLGE
jgi:hypothetical protein